MGLDPAVGHRQQRHPRLPAFAQRPGHLGQRVTGVEHPGAHQVGGDVLVAQREPRRLGAVAGQFAGDRPGLVRPAPTALQVGGAGQGVHAGVEVRADLQVVQPDVVGGVHDRRDLMGARRSVELPRQAACRVRRRWPATARRPASRGSASPRAGTSRRRHHRPEPRSSRLPILPDGATPPRHPVISLMLHRPADPPGPSRAVRSDRAARSAPTAGRPPARRRPAPSRRRGPASWACPR